MNRLPFIILSMINGSEDLASSQTGVWDLDTVGLAATAHTMAFGTIVPTPELGPPYLS